MMKIVALTLLLVAGLSYSSPRAALATNNKVTAGEFLVEGPTLINLGFEWFVEGDDNRNASVEVRYRKVGDAGWKQALPLLRLNGEEIYNGAQLNVVDPNMLGSRTGYRLRMHV